MRGWFVFVALMTACQLGPSGPSASEYCGKIAVGEDAAKAIVAKTARNCALGDGGCTDEMQLRGCLGIGVPPPSGGCARYTDLQSVVAYVDADDNWCCVFVSGGKVVETYWCPL
jgi:hypothetical protein